LNEEDLIWSLPRTALVGIAKSQGWEASTVHSKDDLVFAILDGVPLPPDPLQEVRRRVHESIRKNWDRLRHYIDPDCEECYRNGQQKCTDLRAIADYLINIKLMTIPKE
jgi:hypothetical protein